MIKPRRFYILNKTEKLDERYTLVFDQDNHEERGKGWYIRDTKTGNRSELYFYRAQVLRDFYNDFITWKTPLTND